MNLLTTGIILIPIVALVKADVNTLYVSKSIHDVCTTISIADWVYLIVTLKALVMYLSTIYASVLLSQLPSLCIQYSNYNIL